MARYIDANEVILWTTKFYDDEEITIEKMCEVINEQPTADVVERKKGEWVACDHDKWMHGVYALRCSNCNGGYHLSTEQTIGTWNFCPYCGSDMRKEVE